MTNDQIQMTNVDRPQSRFQVDILHSALCILHLPCPLAYASGYDQFRQT